MQRYTNNALCVCEGEHKGSKTPTETRHDGLREMVTEWRLIQSIRRATRGPNKQLLFLFVLFLGDWKFVSLEPLCVNPSVNPSVNPANVNILIHLLPWCTRPRTSQPIWTVQHTVFVYIPFLQFTSISSNSWTLFDSLKWHLQWPNRGITKSPSWWLKAN